MATVRYIVNDVDAAVAQWGDWQHPLLVTLVFIVVQNLEAMFIAPKIVGNSVPLSFRYRCVASKTSRARHAITM